MNITIPREARSAGADVVERLLDPTDRDAVSDAQEEIKVLRAEVASKNEQFQQYARKMETDMNALAAQNERLRAALKRINVGFVSAKNATAEHDEAIRIARAALEEKP